MSVINPQRSMVGTALSVTGLALLIGFVALFLGASTAVLPWWFIIALLLLPLVLILAITVPEIAIVVCLLFVSGLLPEALGPKLTVGPGTIKTPELSLALLFILALLKWPGMPPLGEYRLWLRPTLVLAAMACVAAGIGYLAFGGILKEVLNDVRNYIGWVFAFTVVCLVRTRKQIDRLQWGLVFVGLAVAAVTLAQFVLGRPLIQNARVEDLNTLNQANPDVARSFIGGGIYFAVFSILFLLARIMTRSVSWIVSLSLIGVLVAALVVTFGRGVWFSTFTASMLMAYWLMRWKGVSIVVVAATVGIVLALTMLGLYKPAVVHAAVDRVLSAGNETVGRNTTLGWRIEEANFALKKIRSSPLVGIGLGVPYKPLIRMNGQFATESDDTLTRYIHNGYLGLWLKFGILGPLVVAWLVWGFLRRGVNMIKTLDDPRLKSLAAAMVASFIVPTMDSISQPEWLSQTGVTFFSLIVGLLIVTHRANAAAAAKATEDSANKVKATLVRPLVRPALGRQ